MVKLADVKVGDRVRVYNEFGSTDGEIISIDLDDGHIQVKKSDGYIAWWHRKQCRKLKPKKVKYKTEGMTFAEAIEYLKGGFRKVTCYDDATQFFISTTLIVDSGDKYECLKVRLRNGESHDWRPTSREILEMKYRVIE